MQIAQVIKKLRLDKASRHLIVNAPDAFLPVISAIAYDTKPAKKYEGTYDYIQVFAANLSELEKLLKSVESAGKHDCLFWACYPKGTGKIKSDLKREAVWEATRTIGLECVTQIAIDDTWSALRARPVEAVGK